MRRIGTLQDGSVARRFCDYLLSLDIDAAVDGGDVSPGGEWDVWIRNEEDVQRAKSELLSFQQTPEAPKYQVEEELAKIRERRVAEHKRKTAVHRNATGSTSEARRPTLGRGSLSQPRQKNIPVTIAIIVISVIASLTSHFGNPRGTRDPSKTTLEQQAYYGLSFVDRRDYEASGDAFASIKQGQWWRFVTPMFLHGDEFHLAFNMLWIFFLGSTIERLHGSFFLLALIMITQTAGMMLQVMLPDASFIPEPLRGSPFAIGASGAVYGLFGFLWIRPFLDPGYPIHLVPMNVVLMIGWLVVCMTPLVPNVANGAHLGGLLSGMLAAVVGPLLRR